MAQSKSKKEIVKMLLKNSELENQNEDELMEILFDEPISLDIDKNMKETATFYDRLADKIASIVGSWGFIFIFSLLLIAWMVLNVFLETSAYDPYPFILLNLFLSCFAALQAPIIMMSQNRSAKRDSLRTKNDYKIDLKSEILLEELHEEIKKVISNQNKIIKLLNNED